MDDSKAGFTSIDAYIATFSPEEQAVLQKLRQTIQAAAPDAVEAISYQMPTFKLNGNLVHFAAYKGHYGFYPAPTGVAAFEADVAPYFAGKGSLNFPKDQPLPYDLVTRIVEYRAEENRAKAKKKKKG